MRQILAAALLVGSAFGMVFWMDARSDELAFDDAAVDQRIDTRLHQVLAGLLERERATRPLPVHPEFAVAKFRAAKP